jgi:dienelactone hydrolase
MIPCSLRLGLLLAALGWLFAPPVTAQVRVTPKESRGGKPLGEPGANVPDEFRGLKVPDWPLPTDRGQWQKDRVKVRATVLQCLGNLPPRPDPARVKVVSRQERDGYILERIEFHNGADALVPGLVMIPRGRPGPFPAVIAAHGHGGSKEILCTDEKNAQCVGPLLVSRGYVVAAIDSYFCGERGGKQGRHGGESDLFKVNLWLGRSLWGMMLRDQQCLIDYLQTRPDVQRDRIGVTGMSMGGTTSWWLAAVDERIQAAVGVAGFTRYTELIAHNNQRLHGVYYFVPGILTHFDTEAIYSLVAPRALLMLSGDQDAGLPLDGIEVLEKKLASVYRLMDKADAFRSVVYKNTGHEYLPEMKAEMVRWFEKHLPVPGK